MQPPRALDGVRVVAFESRRAAELEQLLLRHGATVRLAPALREVAIGTSPEALELAARLEQQAVDVLILLTGVGTRALVEAVRARCPEERFVELLRRTAIVARGPKPVAALRTLGLEATVRVPEPNTWRELLASLDAELPVAGLCVAIQEYGKPNPRLLDGLRERGAEVLRVPVYRWALPHDLAPLHAGIAAILAGEVDLAVFTTAVQVEHLLRVADTPAPRGGDVARALRDDVVVAAIGPTAAEALDEAGIPADILPEHPKLGYLANAIAARGASLVAAKRAARRREPLSAPPRSR